jgi:hypothetical protein
VTDRTDGLQRTAEASDSVVALFAYNTKVLLG